MRFSPEKRAAMADEALRGYRYDQRFVPLSAERLGDGLADQQFVSSIIPESGIAVPVSKDDAAVLVKRADDPWTPVAAISADHRAAWLGRPEERRVGKGCDRTWRSGWAAEQ